MHSLTHSLTHSRLHLFGSGFQRLVVMVSGSGFRVQEFRVCRYFATHLTLVPSQSDPGAPVHTAKLEGCAVSNFVA
jgi:hypothetical protein